MFPAAAARPSFELTSLPSFKTVRESSTWPAASTVSDSFGVASFVLVLLLFLTAVVSPGEGVAVKITPESLGVTACDGDRPACAGLFELPPVPNRASASTWRSRDTFPAALTSFCLVKGSSPSLSRASTSFIARSKKVSLVLHQFISSRLYAYRGGAVGGPFRNAS